METCGQQEKVVSRPLNYYIFFLFINAHKMHSKSGFLHSLAKLYSNNCTVVRNYEYIKYLENT